MVTTSLEVENLQIVQDEEFVQDAIENQHQIFQQLQDFNIVIVVRKETVKQIKSLHMKLLLNGAFVNSLVGPYHIGDMEWFHKGYSQAPKEYNFKSLSG